MRARAHSRRFAAACAALFALGAFSARAALFVSSLETDSSRDAYYSIRSFGRIAGAQDFADGLLAGFDRLIAVPGRAGIAEDRLIRIITAIDAKQPLSPTNPAPLAVLPLDGAPENLLRALSKAYARDDALPDGAHLFSGAPATNAWPRLAVAVSGNAALVSPSETILAWGWANRAQLVNAPRQPIEGTFRLLVNARRFAELLPLEHPELAWAPAACKRIADFDTVVFGLTLDGRQACLSAIGCPREGSEMRKLASAWRQLPGTPWAAIPGNALFSSRSGSSPPAFLDAFAPQPWARLIAPARLEPGALAPFSASWIAPTRDGRGILFARISKLKGKPALPDAPGAAESGVACTPMPSRKLADGSEVRRFRIALAAGQGPAAGSLPLAAASLFLKSAVVEMAISGDALIAATGPDEPLIEQALPALRPESGAMPPGERLALAMPVFKGRSIAAEAELSPVKLIRLAASVVPGIAPEQLESLPAGGDGALAGVSVEAGSGEVVVGVRIGADEIAKLRDIGRDSQRLFHAAFIQLFAKRFAEGPGAEPRNPLAPAEPPRYPTPPSNPKEPQK